MEDSILCGGDQAVASGLASEQAEKCASCGFVLRFKGHDGAAPRNAAHESMAATYANACLLLKRLHQQIDVLEDSSCSGWNGHVTVQYGRQLNRPTLFVARPARNQREDAAIVGDTVQIRQQNVRCVGQVADNLPDIHQGTVGIQVQSHFEQRGFGNEQVFPRTPDADILHVIPIDINRVFNVDGDAELVHQLLRRQIDGARTSPLPQSAWIGVELVARYGHEVRDCLKEK